jgi:hypothetical protein
MNSDNNPLFNVHEIVQVSPEELASVFNEYFNKRVGLINEAVETSRYAVDVNYRTTIEEANFGFAKIALGYVSAALKRMNYHVKLVFSEQPLRIIVSSRNWDDNEWVGMISYNSSLGFFVLSKGYYNRNKKTVTVMTSSKIDGPSSASNMAEKLKKSMDELKSAPERKSTEVKVNLKRGPKS